MCGFNMPTVHTFENAKVLTISMSSGVLIRPIRLLEDGKTFSYEGPFVDSMCVYHSDTLRFINKKLPSRGIKTEQYACTMARQIPFFRFTTEPRLDLGL